MKGFYTQTLVILFSETPDLGLIRMTVERSGFHVRSVEDESDWKEMQGAALMLDWQPEVNGCCVLDVIDHPWPDDMGDPEENPSLFSAWTMGAFGPFTEPGALERARTFGCPVPEAEAAAGHAAFVRVRMTYVFGAGDDAPIRPGDHDPRMELEWLFQLCLAVMEVPGALLFFNPNGEVLMPREDLAAHIDASRDAKVLPLMAIAKARLFAVEDGWQMVDTVGLAQLNLPDHEVAIPPETAFPADAAIRFCWNVSLYLADSGNTIETGHTADGPGGQPWRAETREQSSFSPPRAVTHWTLDSAAPEPPSIRSIHAKTPAADEPVADEAWKQELRDLGARIEVWLEQREAMHDRAVEWLKSAEFKAFYEDMHLSWWNVMLACVFLPLKARDIISGAKSRGLQSKRRWQNYQALAGHGKIWFTLPVIANRGLRANPDQAWPALLLAPVQQGTADVLLGGFLGSFLAEIYSSPSSAHPALSAVMNDDTLQVWRRRMLPAEETRDLQCVAMDMMIKGSFMPPEDLGFIPVLAFPGTSGPAVQVPWHVLSPPKRRLVSAAEARRTPPPLRAPPTHAKPASGGGGLAGCLALVIKAGLLLIAGLLVLGIISALLEPSGKNNNRVRWQAPPGISARAVSTPASEYEPLIGQDLQGSGFLVRIPPGLIAAVTSLHQFDGAAPTQLFDLDDNEYTVDSAQVYRQPESQVQLLTAASSGTPGIPCLDYEADYQLEFGDELRVLLRKGVGIDGTLAASLSLLDGYRSEEGPKMLKLRTQTTENVAGASGSPVILLKTGKVIGVLQAADRSDGPSMIEFETLCFTALPPQSPIPALDATPPAPPSPSSSSDRE